MASDAYLQELEGLVAVYRNAYDRFLRTQQAHEDTKAANKRAEQEHMQAQILLVEARSAVDGWLAKVIHGRGEVF